MDTHLLWQMTTQLHCTLGHLIKVRWHLPNAHLKATNTNHIQIEVTAPCGQIQYEGATRANGHLICLECGSEVPTPLLDPFLQTEHEPCQEKHGPS